MGSMMRYPSFSRIQRVYNAVKRVGEKARAIASKFEEVIEYDLNSWR
jgi:hypothetical protein